MFSTQYSNMVIRITDRLYVLLQGENQRKLRQVGQDLSNVDVSAKNLQRTEKELNAAVCLETQAIMKQICSRLVIVMLFQHLSTGCVRTACSQLVDKQGC
jgi:ribosomal protein L1